MMHYDSIHNPTATALEKGMSRKAIESSHNYLGNHPYNEYNESEMGRVIFLLIPNFYLYIQFPFRTILF